MHGLCLKFITLSCQLTFCQPSFPASVPIPPEKQKTPWNLWLCSTYTWPKRGTYQRGLLPKSYHTGPGSIWDIYVGYQTNWVEKSHFWFFPLHFHHFKEAKPRQKRSLLRSLRTNFSKLHQEIKLRCVAWHVKAKRNSARNQCLATSHDRGWAGLLTFDTPKSQLKPAIQQYHMTFTKKMDLKKMWSISGMRKSGYFWVHLSKAWLTHLTPYQLEWKHSKMIVNKTYQHLDVRRNVPSVAISHMDAVTP